MSKILVIDLGIPLFFLAFLGIILLFDHSFVGIIYAHLFSLILGFMIIWYYGYRKRKLNPFRFHKARLRAELLRFSFPLLIGLFMSLIIKWAGTLMLGRYVGPEAVGIYEVGNSLSLLLMLPLAGLEFVFLPIAGTLHGRGQSEELCRTYQMLTKWIFSATAAAFVILFLFPEQIIKLLFGGRYIDAAPIVRILASGFLFHSFWGPNGIIMVVIGMSQEISYASIFGAIVNIVLNYVMINLYSLGIIGAAIATIGTYISLNILASVVIYKKTGIQPLTVKYFKAILCATLMGFTIYLISGTFPQHPWLVFFYFFIYTIGYAILLIVTKSIDLEDISIFQTMIDTTKTAGRTLKNSISRAV
jgi:O-antigen/teichoic acid export membrane protein